MRTQLRSPGEQIHMRPRILVVDDEAPAQKLIRIRLERDGFHCETAGSFPEASQALSGGSFDAVLTDLRMPGGSGLDLSDLVSERYPETPVILLTGVEDVKTVTSAFRRGISDYLLKPLDGELLVSSVRRAIENARIRKQLREYREFLEVMVEERTTALTQALRQVQLTCDASIEALGRALEYRDFETQGHSRRVAMMSQRLAMAAGIQGDALVTITRGAYLHDLGKIAIPDAILRKPGPLTAEEQQVMRSHVEIGFQMASSIPFLQDAAQIVLTHHEAFDGSGYPRRLRGLEIPIGARIFAIADTVDAITSDRPYRKARSFSAAKEEIVRCSGTQFDPELASIFGRLPESTWSRQDMSEALTPFVAPSLAEAIVN